ncbi:MAG: hypothetical protein ABI193_08100 [Minicystis sp.]
MIHSTTRTSRSRRGIFALAATAALTFTSAGALAQAPPPARNPAAADALFRTARELLKAGDWDAACPKFDASFGLNPTAAILLNIARCHEHQGKLALALTDYEHALVLNRETAGEERKRDLEAVGTAGIEALRPRVPKLRIVAPKAPPGLKVLRDGQELSPSALGEALPADPGSHTITATAPGFRTDTHTIVLEEGKTAEVGLVLTSEPAPAMPLRPTPPEALRPLESEPPPPVAKSGTPTWVWIAGGGGIVLAAVGVGIGVDAAGAKSTIAKNCPLSPEGIPTCPTLPEDEIARLNGRKNRGFPIAIGLGVTGGVAIGAAIVGWALGPSRKASAGAKRTWQPTGWAAPSGSGIGVEGAF